MCPGSGRLIYWSFGSAPGKCVSSSFTLSEEEALLLPLLLKMGNCISREIITLSGDVENAPVIIERTLLFGAGLC